MSINIAKAFTFMFKENNWLVKILIGSVLFFFIKIFQFAIDTARTNFFSPADILSSFSSPNLPDAITPIAVIIGLIAMITACIWMLATALGYVVTTLGNFTKDETPMPDWDGSIGAYFSRGLKILVAQTVILSGIALFIYGAQILIGMLLFMSPFFAMISIVLCIAIILYILYLFPALLLSFCKYYRFIDAINLVNAKRISTKSTRNYVLAIFLLIAITLLTTVIITIFFQMKIGILVLPPVCFYLLIAKLNIIGQYYNSYLKD